MSVTEASLLVPKGGRPRAAEPGSTVSIWIPASYHDRWIRLAKLYDVSVSEFGKKAMMRVIDRALDTD